MVVIRILNLKFMFTLRQNIVNALLHKYEYFKDIEGLIKCIPVISRANLMYIKLTIDQFASSILIFNNLLAKNI